MAQQSELLRNLTVFDKQTKKKITNSAVISRLIKLIYELKIVFDFESESSPMLGACRFEWKQSTRLPAGDHKRRFSVSCVLRGMKWFRWFMVGVCRFAENDQREIQCITLPEHDGAGWLLVDHKFPAKQMISVLNF